MRRFENWSFRRKTGNSRRWFRRLKADIRLGHLGAWAGDHNAAKAVDQIMPEQSNDPCNLDIVTLHFGAAGAEPWRQTVNV